MRHELPIPYAHKHLYGGLILGVNTLYRRFRFFKLFPMVSKGLIHTSIIESIFREIRAAKREKNGGWVCLGEDVKLTHSLNTCSVIVRHLLGG